MGNSTIKPKKGQCLDCEEGSGEKYLTAKRCEYHYKKHRSEVNGKKPAAKARLDRKAELNVYFAAQILTIPERCENCNARLILPRAIDRRSAICHIVPKEFYRTVETHPQNRWFGCIDCHTDYDRKGEAHQAGMPVAPVVIQRFHLFKDLLNREEVRRLPKYLQDEYYR